MLDHDRRAGPAQVRVDDGGGPRGGGAGVRALRGVPRRRRHDEAAVQARRAEGRRAVPGVDPAAGRRAVHGLGRHRDRPPPADPRDHRPARRGLRAARPARAPRRAPRDARRAGRSPCARRAWPSARSSPRRSTSGACSPPCPRPSARGWTRWRGCEVLATLSLDVDDTRAADLARSELEEVVERVQGGVPLARQAPELIAVLEALRRRDADAYVDAVLAVEAAHDEARDQRRADALGERLERAAPGVLALLRAHAGEAWPEREARFDRAWAFARAAARVAQWAAAEDAPDRLADLDVELARVTARLAAAQAWRACLSRITAEQMRALQSHRASVSAVGRGTGRFADRYRTAAREAVAVARDAVPAWVMPIREVLSAVEPRPRRVRRGDRRRGQPGRPDQPLPALARPAGDRRRRRPAVHARRRRRRLARARVRAAGDRPARRAVLPAQPVHAAGERVLGVPGDVRPADPAARALPLDARDRRLVVAGVLRGARRRGRRRAAGAAAPVRRRPAPAAAGDVRARRDGARAGLVAGQRRRGGRARRRRRALRRRPGLRRRDVRGRRAAGPRAGRADRGPAARAARGRRVGDPAPAGRRRRGLPGRRARRRLALDGRRAGAPPGVADRRALPPGLQRRRVPGPRPDVAVPLGPRRGPRPRRPAPQAPRARHRDRARRLRRRAREPPGARAWSTATTATRRSGACSRSGCSPTSPRSGFAVVPQVEVHGRTLDLVVTGANGRLAVVCDGDEHRRAATRADVEAEHDLRRCGWPVVRVAESRYVTDPEAALAPVLEAAAAAGITPSAPTGPLAVVESAPGRPHRVPAAARALRARGAGRGGAGDARGPRRRPRRPGLPAPAPRGPGARPARRRRAHRRRRALADRASAGAPSPRRSSSTPTSPNPPRTACAPSATRCSPPSPTSAPTSGSRRSVRSLVSAAARR